MPEKANWTTGEWMPEIEPPTFNEGVNAYQMAIIQCDNGRIIPGFAFGETPEQCLANAWLMSSAKDLLKGIQALSKGLPNATEIINEAIQKAMGHLQPQK